MRSAEYHVERRAPLGGNEHQLSAMTVAHDTASERKADPPPFLLGRESRIEDLVTDLARNAGSIVRHADSHSTFRQRLRRDLDLAIPPRQRIDRILRQRFERPLEQHRVTLDDEVALVRGRD